MTRELVNRMLARRPKEEPEPAPPVRSRGPRVCPCELDEDLAGPYDPEQSWP